MTEEAYNDDKKCNLTEAPRVVSVCHYRSRDYNCHHHAVSLYSLIRCKHCLITSGH